MNITRNDIYERISNANQVSEVLNLIDIALAMDHEPELDCNIVMDCCLFGINRMAELTVDDPKLAQDLLAGRVLALCIDDGNDEVKRYHYAEARKSVVKWMEQYAEPEMCNIRQALISQVIQRLQQSPHQDLAWMLAAIGYRTKEITSVLKEVVFSKASEQAARFAALSTICSLGNLSDEDKEQIRVFAETHLKTTTSIPLFSTLRMLKSPRSIDYLLNSLDSSTAEQQETFFSGLCLGALSDIAEAHPKVAKQIWDGVIHAVTANKDTERRLRINSLIFDKTLLGKFDLTDVPEQLLRFLAERPEMDDQSKHFRYLIYLRLTELTGWLQLAALSSEQNLQIIELLKTDCTLNTTNATRNMSSEDRLKEAAWDVALRMGFSDALGWFSAITDEVSPFMRGRILKHLACFSRQILPDIIGTWLTTRLDWNGNDLPEIFYIEPTIKMAAYSSDPRALNWLLDFGVTYRGHVPTNAAEGLGVYCLEHISRADDAFSATRQLTEQLLAAFKADWNGKTDRINQRRVLAAAALEAIASKHKLTESEQQSIATIFDELDVAQDVVALCMLARVVVGGSPSEVALKKVEELAMHDNRWIAAHGIYALDLAGVSSQVLRVHDKQGVVVSEGHWKVTEPSKLSEQGAYLLGRFYLNDQATAKDAVIAVLTHGEWKAVSLLIATLGKELSAGEHDDEVVEALISRIIAKVSFAYSENNLFKGLATFSPSALLKTPWNEYWDNWSSESMIALIQAIIVSQAADVNLHSLAIAILSELESSSVEEVRQEARLAWSVLDNDSFADAIIRRSSEQQAWSFASQRRLAAEACWVIQDESKFLDVSSRLKDDPDRRVRELCSESIRRREERAKANESFDKIVSCLLSDSLMLSAWKYGDMLVEFGGADNLEKLMETVSNTDTPPNRRYWLSLLTERLEKRIKEKKRKNIPDWSPVGPHVLRSEGVLISGEIECSAIFVIRKWPTEKLDECLRWEGDGWLTDKSSHIPIPATHVEIKLDNGDSGTAFVSSWSITPSRFSFNGEKYVESGHIKPSAETLL
ncbi:hypothetical protein [Trichlorobacter lovleyi]|uniref:hypothetical protein n=1 Tax=Trichlorobacter lovleyi TaxID=313985 RepID=UPI003D0DEA51